MKIMYVYTKRIQQKLKFTQHTQNLDIPSSSVKGDFIHQLDFSGLS